LDTRLPACSHCYIEPTFTILAERRLRLCRRRRLRWKWLRKRASLLSSLGRGSQEVGLWRSLGKRKRGVAQIREGLAMASTTGAEMWHTYNLAQLAEACVKAGRIDEGLEA